MLTKHEILEKELARESATILRVLRENFIRGWCLDHNDQIFESLTGVHDNGVSSRARGAFVDGIM